MFAALEVDWPRVGGVLANLNGDLKRSAVDIKKLTPSQD